MTDPIHDQSRIVTDTPDALDHTHRLIASDRVEGTKVYNPTGDHVGSIHSVMLDKISGKVSYAVMSFGGFLGIGERYHPLPWDALKFDPEFGGYRVSVSREQLENAPSYGREEDPWVDAEYGRNVYAYYGMPFYH